MHVSDTSSFSVHTSSICSSFATAVPTTMNYQFLKYPECSTMRTESSQGPGNKSPSYVTVNHEFACLPFHRLFSVCLFFPSLHLLLSHALLPYCPSSLTVSPSQPTLASYLPLSLLKSQVISCTYLCLSSHTHTHTPEKQLYYSPQLETTQHECLCELQCVCVLCCFSLSVL